MVELARQQHHVRGPLKEPGRAAFVDRHSDGFQGRLSPNIAADTRRTIVQHLGEVYYMRRLYTIFCAMFGTYKCLPIGLSLGISRAVFANKGRCMIRSPQLHKLNPGPVNTCSIYFVRCLTTYAYVQPRHDRHMDKKSEPTSSGCDHHRQVSHNKTHLRLSWNAKSTTILPSV